MKSSRATLRNPDELWPNEITGADNAVHAQQHLAEMSFARRAMLEAEWAAAEHHREPSRPEIVARAKAEWDQTPSRIDGLERSDV